MTRRAPAKPRGAAEVSVTRSHGRRVALAAAASRSRAGPPAAESPAAAAAPAPGPAYDDPKRTCTGRCKQYRAKRPASGGRYEAGHGRCQTCDIWIDYRGGHLHDGRPATKGSIGWYCNCCNFRIRRNPRNAEYKQRLRYSSRGGRGRGRGAEGGGDGAAGDAPVAAGPAAEADGAPGPAASGGGAEAEGRDEDGEPAGIDLSYFNKRRARMLRDLGRIMKKTSWERPDVPEDLVEMLENEFGAPLADILALARSESPNKASLIVDFERVRISLGSVPTRQEMRKNGARFPLSAYDAEFESWGHLLDRLGYDPWYRY